MRSSCLNCAVEFVGNLQISCVPLLLNHNSLNCSSVLQHLLGAVGSLARDVVHVAGRNDRFRELLESFAKAARVLKLGFWL